MTRYRNHLLIILGYLLLAFLTYGGNHDHKLLHWDDITYVSSNPWVTQPSWANILKMFSEFWLLNWHPLTWLSYVPEYYFCGETANCYITTNILIHTANSFLIYLLALIILKEYTKNIPKHIPIRLAAVISGVFFVIHPLHTESVIWIAERKDVLYSLFYLLGLLSYINCYKKDDVAVYSLSTFLWYICALMSKSMAVTFPAVLILLDAFLLERLKNASSNQLFRIFITEKIHYHIGAAFIIVLTFSTQQIELSTQPTLIEKIFTISAAFHHYIYSFFIPINLSPFYPSSIEKTGINLFGVLFMLILFTTIAFSIRFREWQLFWGFLMVTISPVIGVISIGDIAYADRYTYLTMSGFYIACAYFICRIIHDNEYKPIFLYFLTIIMLSMIWSTRQYKEVWANDLSLWSYVVKRFPDKSPVIHDNLGNSYFELGRYKEAIEQYEKVIALNPQSIGTYGNLAKANLKLGDTSAFLASYEKGIKNNPQAPWIYIEAGDAFRQQQQFQRAFLYYKRTLNIVPDYNYGMLRLGLMLYKQRDYDTSIALLEKIRSDELTGDESKLLLAQAYLKIGSINKSRDLVNELEKKLGKTHRFIVGMRKLFSEKE